MQINSQLQLVQDKFLSYLTRMNDVRFMGQVVFVIIVLMISWSGVKSIQTNYGLQKQITALNQQNTLQKLQNDNLALKNQYLKSNQYLELSARENFGLAAAGEKEVIVPAKVAQAYTVDLPALLESSKAKPKPSAIQRNYQSWVDFFLHRQNSDN